MSEAKADNGVAAEIEGGRAWASEQPGSIDKQVRWFLTAHPIASLACTVGIGFVVARLFAGRRSE